MSKQFGEYTLHEEGEAGGYGQIFLVKKNENDIYVLKTLLSNQLNKENIKDFNNEIDILS